MPLRLQDLKKCMCPSLAPVKAALVYAGSTLDCADASALNKLTEECGRVGLARRLAPCAYQLVFCCTSSLPSRLLLFGAYDLKFLFVAWPQLRTISPRTPGCSE